MPLGPADREEVESGFQKVPHSSLQQGRRPTPAAGQPIGQRKPCNEQDFGVLEGDVVRDLALHSLLGSY